MSINIECGQRLKKCRLLSGYTQEALGNKANYKKETVCMFERGKRKLSVDAANNFAKVLHVRADYLLCRDDNIFPEEKTKSNTTNYQKANCFDTLLNFYNYELYGIPENEDEASGIDMLNIPMRLNKGFIIKSPQNKLFYCPSNLLDELIEDVMDYALMRLDKRLLPQCHEPNDSELEAAGLTPEGAYVPPTLSLRHLKIPDLNFLREFSHSSTESKNNNSTDYTEE